ncbi:MAG: rod shape-determining protein, partial [Cytophagales bacterium]
DKDIREGIPASRWINQVELCHVLEKPFLQIESSIHQSLEICAPELAGDILQNGLYITGGNARLKGYKNDLVACLDYLLTLTHNHCCLLVMV